MPMKRAEGREECGPKRCPRGHGTAAVPGVRPWPRVVFPDPWRTPRRQRSPPQSGGTRPARRARSPVPRSWRACSCWARRSSSWLPWGRRCSTTSSRPCATRSARPRLRTSRTAGSAASSRPSPRRCSSSRCRSSVAVAGAGLLASVAQVRPRLVLSGLKPDFKRVSPKSGAKRIASSAQHRRARQERRQADRRLGRRRSRRSGPAATTSPRSACCSRPRRCGSSGTSCSTSPGACSGRSP